MGNTPLLINGVGTALLIALTVAQAQAQVTFPRVFAPQEGRVAPIERPHRSEICLNGSWQFQPLSLPPGFQTGKGTVPELPEPGANGWDKTPIRIPSPWNVNTFPDSKGFGGDFRCFPSYPAAWDAAPMGWLRRSFTVPSGWKGQRLRLHFDAVAGDTVVRVNGKTVATHFDNFLPLEADITDAVYQDGRPNELMVGVRKASLFDVPGKYGRRTYQGGSMWGQHIAGIWQDVFLEAVPVVHVDDVFPKPLLNRDRLEVEVRVRNDGDAPATVTVTGDAYAWHNHAGTDTLSAPEPKGTLDKASALRTAPASVTVPAHGTATVTLAADSVGKRLKTWSPETPHLYGFVSRLSSDKKQHDTKYTRFGWRQITLAGSQVLLNGKPLVMRGDSWHFMGIPQMTRRYAWAWFTAMRAAHMNAVRLHAQPYPTFYLDVADEQGILVLDEDAVWASDGGPKIDDPAFWTNTETHLRGLVLRDRNHPSVFGWSVSNEMMAVLRGVFHAPQEFQDRTRAYYGKWRDICAVLDPTRAWISADGEDDGDGALPVYVVHYGGTGALERAAKSGKPWGVGEAGPAYYGTPEQIAEQSGNERAYVSFADRMDGVAAVSYQSLIDQRKYGGSYRSVFNMVWYGLKPLELGMHDTTKPPALSDGIFFSRFVEGVPGVQPERLGPYCTTLNPGYDPKLPLYAPWSLFTAIRNASAEPPVALASTAAKTVPAKPATPNPIYGTPLLARTDSPLAKALQELGVPVHPTEILSSDLGPLVFVDGAHPPAGSAKPILQAVLERGGTLFVWGTDRDTLSQLNALLPAPLELTDRTASSLMVPAPAAGDPALAGITPAALYFSELSPSQILGDGLGGSFVEKGTTLLAASDTDWQRWNRQPETTKTAMVLRSEREKKPSGAALVSYSVGKGRVIVCNLPVAAQTTQAVTLYRAVLTNLGIQLSEAAAQRNMLRSEGGVTRVLGLGKIPVASMDEGTAATFVAPNAGATLVSGAITKDRTWTPLSTAENDMLDFHALRGIDPKQASVTYLSFWLYSPKALDNLLLDPNLPNLDLVIRGVPPPQVWLNGQAAKVQVQESDNEAPTLRMQQGWNHVLIKVVLPPGTESNGAVIFLRSNQPEYIKQLRGAQEKP